MSSPDQFIGGYFAWFTGVIEDIKDPMQMGRVRVRCIGYHTSDKGRIPTNALPWALVMMPVTSAAMSGVGRSPTGLLQGSWVIGFFRDGPSAQDPVVIGSIPSVSTGGDPAKGFSDPTGVNPIRPGEVDTPQEARSEFADTSAFVKRKDLRQEKIETAVPAKISTVAIDEDSSYYERQTWSNWDVDKTVNPIYPNNHVWHTQGGHVFEVDDTEGARRIFEMHASGTYREINAGGDRTTTIVGDDFTVVIGSDNIYVKGSCNLTVDGNFRQLVKGNYHLEVEGNKTENIKGSRQAKIGNSDQTEIVQESATNIGSNFKERIGGDSTIIRDGFKNETIGANSDILVSGDDSHIVLGTRQEYTDSHLEVSTNGHLIFVSNEDLSIETKSNLNTNVEGDALTDVAGDVTETLHGNQDTTISGDLDTTVSGDLTLIGSTINFNP